MPFRSESELVYAANCSIDLSNLVISYLVLYRKYSKGKDGYTIPKMIKIPDEPFTVVFLPPTEGKINVTLVSTRTVTWSQPYYYDVDSDNYSEAWGADNTAGHIGKSATSIEESTISISFKALLCSKEEMEKSIKTFAEAKLAEHKEEIRQHQIRQLEEQLSNLRNQQP